MQGMILLSLPMVSARFGPKRYAVWLSQPKANRNSPRLDDDFICSWCVYLHHSASFDSASARSVHGKSCNRLARQQARPVSIIIPSLADSQIRSRPPGTGDRLVGSRAAVVHAWLPSTSLPWLAPERDQRPIRGLDECLTDSLTDMSS